MFKTKRKSSLKKYQKLSIVIPCYNEEKTLEQCVERVFSTKLNIPQKEIVIVDDCSKDKSLQIAKKLASKNKAIKVFSHAKNQGKGAALRTGFEKSTGDILVVQDADMEYDPIDFNLMLNPILKDKAQVVYGSRFLSGLPHRVLYFWHMIGNQLLTLLSNMFSDLNLTDMETCYKMMTRFVVDKIDLTEKRFGIEPEMTAKIAAVTKEHGLAVYEVGISYSGRTYSEGKKIGLKDAFSALRCIVLYNTTLVARLTRYFINGLVVAASQLLTITALVEGFALNTKLAQLVVYGVSIEVSILIGYFLHSKFTWGFSKDKQNGVFYKIVSFHSVTAFSFAVRLLVFYLLATMNMSYMINTLIGISIAIVLNFFGYDRLVFKTLKNKWDEVIP